MNTEIPSLVECKQYYYKEDTSGIFTLYTNPATLFIGLMPTYRAREDIKSFLVHVVHFWLMAKNVPIQKNACILLLVEIWKNIHDHANNHGYIIIHWDGELFSFKATDYGLRPIILKKALKPHHSTKLGNGVNYGIGMHSIKAMGHSLFTEFQTIATFGIRYSGSKSFKPSD